MVASVANEILQNASCLFGHFKVVFGHFKVVFGQFAFSERHIPGDYKLAKDPLENGSQQWGSASSVVYKTESTFMEIGWCTMLGS